MEEIQPIESVTIPETKTKNPKRVAWGKKLGAMKKKPDDMTYSLGYIPILVIGVGIAGYVIWTLRDVEKPKQITSIPKEKLKFDSF